MKKVLLALGFTIASIPTSAEVVRTQLFNRVLIQDFAVLPIKSGKTYNVGISGGEAELFRTVTVQGQQLPYYSKEQAYGWVQPGENNLVHLNF
ncbi:MAG: hypothetical protein OXT49_02905 [Gammaproteobacteria bacterium]|nr:hypothetical protein [Gammaproteobacteria bacterium]